MTAGAVIGAVFRAALGPVSPRTPAQSPARSGLLPYLPAIDGLRALAVAAVLIYHAEEGWLPGGFLGVEVFFVISGYLITSLLLIEKGERGSVGLRGFWARRAKRLLPAVATLVVSLLAYAVVFLPEEVATLRSDALAAGGYVSNWYLIFDDKSYFEALGRPSLLRHLWSLAVEEQFYVCFPIVFSLVLARVRRGYAVAALLAGAVASSALMAWRYDPLTDASRIYYGTDTRISGLLIGAALAMVWAPGRLPQRVVEATRQTATTFGVLAFTGLGCFALMLGDSDRMLYQGGFAAVALLTALLIAAVVHPSAKMLHLGLGSKPLVWIGLRSYGIYLWHWPVFMLTRPGLDVEIDGALLLALRLGLTLVIAEASYRLVEMPVRNGAFGRAWQSLRRRSRLSLAPFALRPFAALGTAFTGVIVLGFSVAAADPPGLPEYLPSEEVQVVSWSRPLPQPVLALEGQLQPRAPATPAPTTEPTPAATETGAPAQPPTPGVTEPPITAPPAPPPETGTPTPPPPTGIVSPRVFAIGDSVMLGASDSLVSTIPNIEVDAAVSRQVYAGIEVLRARRDAGTLGDVVVVHLGNNGTFSGEQFDEIMSILANVPRVVFVSVRVPRDWEGPNQATVADGVGRYPNAVLLDWYGSTAANMDFFVEDGIHLQRPGADFYAQLIQSFAQ